MGQKFSSRFVKVGGETMDFTKALTYAPVLYFDENEPFYPCMVGVTEIFEEQASPSFKRTFPSFHEELDVILEYAIYWDFDIQHLYELEHVWVYVDKDGAVIDCEASFHGRYFKGLLLDKSNLVDGTHVKLYSQPGKHAFLPKPEMFELIPNLLTCTNQDAGKDGLLIPDFLHHILTTNEETQELVSHYLKKFAFTPSMKFLPYRFPKEIFYEWDEVYHEIPIRIERKLLQIKTLSVY